MSETTRSAVRSSVKSPASTPPKRVRVLVVDDEPDACESLRLLLENEGYEATGELSPRRALEKVANQNFDLVLTDIAMTEMNGLDLCRNVLDAQPLLPVVLVTGRASMDAAIQALRLGARDFLTKPLDASALVASMRRALQPLPGVVDAGRPTDSVENQGECTLTGVVGQSSGIRQVYRLIADLAGSAASVLLQGETGTGKEIIARAIHENSHFRDGPFVALNCAAMPAGLLESELFGHARGAFTDAKTATRGLLVEANGGTLLLDEIGELPLEMQPKLLRALQQRTVRPVGQHEEVPFDCRLITATNRDLGVEVSAKRFREDLFYRLDVVRITVPPLRERGDDILLLARHFLEHFAANSKRSLRLSAAVEERLLAYSWPGNVRELENCIERAVAFCLGDELSIEDLAEKVQAQSTRPAAKAKGESAAKLASLFDVERDHILQALESLGGNKTQAAELLGLDRRTLERRLKRYETR